MAKQRVIVIVFVGLLFAALAASATYGGSSGSAASPLVRSGPIAGGAMPASVRVRDAWVRVLRCQYAHGATKQPLGGDSFQVVGLTSEIRAACADLEAQAQGEMSSAAYVAERAVITDVVRAAWACVASKGIELGDDHAISDTATVPPGTEAAFRQCKERVEAERGLTEPAALP
jgi:hypothetical protein